MIAITSFVYLVNRKCSKNYYLTENTKRTISSAIKMVNAKTVNICLAFGHISSSGQNLVHKHFFKTT